MIFVKNKRSTGVYCVIQVSGCFAIGDRRYGVNQRTLVEIPPQAEYSYSGTMKLTAVSKPRWLAGNQRHTELNPDFVEGEFPLSEGGPSWNIYGKLPDIWWQIA
jgi:hypothetical protein